MKITSFSPLIVSEKAEDITKLFEELGFEKKHCNKDITASASYDATMLDADGNRIDVTKVVQLPKDITLIRMNVDDFDEAYEFLTSRGFKQQGKTAVLPSSKSAMMVSPSGFAFDLCQHIK